MIVDIVKEVTTAQWNNATEEGLYYINDKPDSIITAEQVAYGSGNVKTTLDDLSDSDTYTVPTTPTDYGSITFTKRGSTVEVTIFGLKNLSANDYTTVASLPLKYRPSALKYFVMSEPAGRYVRIAISANGTVKIYLYSADTSLLNISDTRVYLV